MTVPVTIRVDRSRLAAVDPLSVIPDGPSAAELSSLLDLVDIPDTYPFVVGADGSMDGTTDLNRYLVAARRDRAYFLRSISQHHVVHLRRFQEFLWERHGARVELGSATRKDLVAYREMRREQITASSWNTEIGCIGSFYEWARRDGLIDGTPIPRWGTARRNTLLEPVEDRRTPKFLNEHEIPFVLAVGLRGDRIYRQAPVPFIPGREPSPPAYPNRDYALGFLEVDSGMRREETVYLLDCELPSRLGPATSRPAHHGSGLYQFTRVGKGRKPRPVFVTSTALDVIDIYRDRERAAMIQAAQHQLRKRYDRLLIVDDVRCNRGKVELRIGGRWRHADLLSNADRRRAVWPRSDGTLEPLGLFITQRGLPPALNYINELYDDANERLLASTHPDQPHIRVGNHTMRHTFAVRTLAALIQCAERSDTYRLATSPIITVMELLGHRSPDTTMRYLKGAQDYTRLEDIYLDNAERISQHVNGAP